MSVIHIGRDIKQDRYLLDYIKELGCIQPCEIDAKFDVRGTEYIQARLSAMAASGYIFYDTGGCDGYLEGAERWIMTPAGERYIKENGDHNERPIWIRKEEREERRATA